ncbi:hypothetical protein AUEXF2481DRAFT_38907 [Aureobasidium subglaciale EXF-2481]|uniref:Uncharacterized protein n=1 Tax=Aureobasidium subglaciale (strain EXF-2481) TaxID=1043005 RepID=A0A074YG16_AURSE|nr:uncharacterized protein AUEXF2481DRAFT_38907 [Aureobasidium subglaciale EXF-2481]KEQ96645.1 hypothetical protein AUEXF2481DRAFT_38907 [Aureobasidium subglaciale EXF-2481]
MTLNDSKLRPNPQNEPATCQSGIEAEPPKYSRDTSPPVYSSVEEQWDVRFTTRYIPGDAEPGHGRKGMLVSRAVRDQGRLTCARYGIADQKQAQPDVVFTCALQPRVSRLGTDWARSMMIWSSWKTARELATHRHVKKCQCDSKYIATGFSAHGDMTRMCNVRDAKVKKRMERHDRRCACNVFKSVVESSSVVGG